MFKANSSQVQAGRCIQRASGVNDNSGPRNSRKHLRVLRYVGVELLSTVLQYEAGMIQCLNRPEPAVILVEPTQKLRILPAAKDDDSFATASECEVCFD